MEDKMKSFEAMFRDLYNKALTASETEESLMSQTYNQGKAHAFKLAFGAIHTCLNMDKSEQ